jgi:hypothetical protein
MVGIQRFGRYAAFVFKVEVRDLGDVSTEFYGTRRFITAFAVTRHMPPVMNRFYQVTLSNPVHLRSILIFSCQLLLGLRSGLLPSGFSTKILYTVLISATHATCPADLIFPDFITLIICNEEYSYETPHYAVFSSLRPLLGPNILLSTLFSNTLNPCETCDFKPFNILPHHYTAS